MSRESYDREGPSLEAWVPRTQLGKMVKEGQITSIYDIFREGFKVREVEIIDSLVPELRDEVIDITMVQKQTDAGENSRFRAVVAIGNGNGLVGIGVGKAKRVRNAIEKGIRTAKLNLYPVKRGCGSWECGCGTQHSVPFKVSGKSGSVVVTLLPGPQGLGQVVGDNAKVILTLAGIKDCWSKATGTTSTVCSFSYATFEALKQTAKIMTPQEWAK